MIIYPAIDCRNGQCVRLYQGNYQQQTTYDNDPYAQVAKFSAEGATWLHIVDLDGAKNPQQSQHAFIAELITASSLNIQVGGGIRSGDHITQLLNSGARRVIIGSLAVTAPEQVYEWLHYFGCERIVLAFDVVYQHSQNPMITTNAWQTITQTSLFEMLKFYQSAALKHVICTDISRDGTLTGPNNRLYKTIMAKFPDLQLQASGGIHALSDIQFLKQAHMPGVIIGRALYENKFTLAEALAC